MLVAATNRKGMRRAADMSCTEIRMAGLKVQGLKMLPMPSTHTKKMVSLSARLVLLAATAACARGPVSWRALAPGIEFTWLRHDSTAATGDTQVAVLRIDPKAWRFTAICQSQTGDTTGKTARQWAREHNLVVATNAGMFHKDYLTHVGYLAHDGHVNSTKVNHYESVFAFGVRGDHNSLPHARLFDLDAPGITILSISRQYTSAVQNLRLIRRPGINRWKQQQSKWSEAAIGEDDKGRILFVHSRQPFTMWEFNELMLRSNLGVVAMQHLEGGPEAQLYINVGSFELERFGSYETSFREDDTNAIAWPVPNVIGVRRD
jgi:uncharacterized protein YigE (DUF2233 family)